MIFPNGHITVRKLEEMIDNPQNWTIFAKNEFTKEEKLINDRNDLREYIFYDDYKIGYDFVGDWEEYNAPKNKDDILYRWKKGSIEIKVKKEGDNISAEILKWENDNPYAEDTPNCFVLAYWNTDDLVFVGDRFFKYISWWKLPMMYKKIKKVQKIVENFYLNSED